MVPEGVEATAELHVHLRGAMPADFFARMLQRRSPAQALATAPQRHLDFFGRYPHLQPFLRPDFDPSRAAELFGFTDFPGFLASYLLSSYFVRTAQDFRELVDSVASALAAQGLRYAEVIVSVPEYRMHGIELEAIVEALSDASRRRDIRLRWIVDLVRNFGHEAGLELLQQLLQNPPEGWVGITIGGAEADFPPAPFADCFRLARAHGLGLTAHAGEAAGPQSVWDAVRLLQVDRIGHGVRTVEDPRLVDYLAENQIPLEICLTSNLKTGVYGSLREHPLPQLVEAGVPVTLNTDDPSFFGTTLKGEFAAARSLGLSEAALETAAENVAKFAFDRPTNGGSSGRLESRPNPGDVKRSTDAGR